MPLTRALLLLHFCWVIILSSLPIVFAINGDKTYCNQVLNEENLAVMKSTSIESFPEPVIFYDVFPKKDFATDFCDMDSEHGIRFSLDRITQISDILIEVLSFVPNPDHINVSIWRGAISFQCAYNSTKLQYTNRTFFDYKCVANATAGYSRTGFYINTIEMKSVTPLTLNVTNLKRQRALGWLVPIQYGMESGTHYPERCPPPGLYPRQIIKPVKSFYSTGNKVAIQCEDEGFVLKPPNDQRRCESNGTWSPNQQLPRCQPTKRDWYKSQPSPFNRSVSAGMRNVSHVFFFNRDFYNISKLSFDFTTAISPGDFISKNCVIQVISSANVVYEYHVPPLTKNHNWTGLVHTVGTPLPFCENCSARITFLEYYWDFWILKDLIEINASSPIDNFRGDRMLSNGCSPIDPYIGMPPTYANYDLILNGSINELLRQSPCRPGYTFSGTKSETYQCRNGTWIGNRFPKCTLIRTRTPPKVDGAVWRYIHHDVFHEIQYTGKLSHAVLHEIPYTRNVSYNVEADNWFGLDGSDATGRQEIPPELHKTDASSLWSNSLPYIIAGVLSAIAVILFAAAVVTMRKVRRRSRVKPLAVITKRKEERPDEAKHQTKPTFFSADDVITQGHTQYNDGCVAPESVKQQDGLYLMPRGSNHQEQSSPPATGTADAHFYDDVANQAHIYEEINCDRIRGAHIIYDDINNA